MPWLYLIPAALLFPAGIALAIWSLFWDRPRRGTLRCPRCWYDLTSLARVDRHSVPIPCATDVQSSAVPTCPECGHTARKPKNLRRTRRRWFVGAFSHLMIAAAITLAIWPYARAHGWLWLIPTPVLVRATFGENAKPGSIFSSELVNRAQYDVFGPGQRHWVVGVAIRSLEDRQRPDQRRLAVQLLGLVGARDPRITRALLHVAEHDPIHSVRLDAIQMLGHYRADADRTIPLLIRIIESDSDAALHATAISALERYRTIGRHAAPTILAVLEEADPDSEVARYAVETLRAMQLEPSVALPHLIRILEQSTNMARYEALDALSVLGPEAAPAVPSILALILRGELSTRDAAHTLAQIGPAARDALPQLDAGPFTPYHESVAIDVIEGRYTSTIEAHIASLNDPASPFHREAAYELQYAARLGLQFSPQEIEALVAFLGKEPDRRLTQPIANALSAMPGAHEAPILPALKEYAATGRRGGKNALNLVLRQETLFPAPPPDENAR